MIVDDAAVEFLSHVCDGDARQALSTLEVAVMSCFEKPVKLSKDLIRDSIQKRAIQYDASGDETLRLCKCVNQKYSRKRSRRRNLLVGQNAGGGRGHSFFCVVA